MGRSEITFPSLQDEGYTVPSFILDVNGKSTECRTSTALRDSIIIQVPGLASVEGLPILPDDHVLGFNSRNSSEYTNLQENISRYSGNPQI